MHDPKQCPKIPYVPPCKPPQFIVVYSYCSVMSDCALSSCTVISHMIAETSLSQWFGGKRSQFSKTQRKHDMIFLIFDKNLRSPPPEILFKICWKYKTRRKHKMRFLAILTKRPQDLNFQNSLARRHSGVIINLSKISILENTYRSFSLIKLYSNIKPEPQNHSSPRNNVK